jgi:MscS family membrane protein
MKAGIVPIKIIMAGNASAPKANAEHHHSLSTLYAQMMHALNLHRLLMSNSWMNWLILIAAIFVGAAIGRAIIVALTSVGTRLEKRGWHFQAVLVASLARPANLVVFAVSLLIGLGQLHLNGILRLASGKMVVLLIAIGVFWYLYNVVEMVELALKGFIRRHETPLTEQVLPIIRKTLRVFVMIVAVLFITQNIFDRDIGSWLAGLGIAGLAVSLAAQDSLKNLFGSATIFLDRPFLTGQQVTYQGFNGVVEDIGFRSTRLRLFDGTLVSVPNSDIVNTSVQNISARPFLRRFLTIGITYDVGVDRMREAVECVRRILESDEFRGPIHNPENPNDYPPRVYFNDFATDSLNITIYYYYRPVSDYWGFIDFNQRFNLKMMEEFEKAGIEFAFTSRTVYLAGDPKRRLPVYLIKDDSAPPPESAAS